MDNLKQLPEMGKLAQEATAAFWAYDKAVGASKAKLLTNSPNLRKLNEKLRSAEAQLIDASGLPRRAWYRHLLYAPGFYTGYGVKTIPGVREAIEERKWDEVREQISRAAETLSRVADAIDRATKP